MTVCNFSICIVCSVNGSMLMLSLSIALFPVFDWVANFAIITSFKTAAGTASFSFCLVVFLSPFI